MIDTKNGDLSTPKKGRIACPEAAFPGVYRRYCQADRGLPVYLPSENGKRWRWFFGG